jgi:hypothetical protein
VGLERWQLASGEIRKSVSVGGELERRLFADRISARVDASRWSGFGSPAFSTAGVNVSFASRRRPAPLVLLVEGGATIATKASPLALWSGAGEGRARGALLRAHPLLHSGRIDGAVFGRRLVSGTAEAQHWFRRPALVRLGAAAFVDAARASQRLEGTTGRPFQVDAGAGLRVRVPGSSSTLRIDYARGVRDGTHAWTVAWQTW